MLFLCSCVRFSCSFFAKTLSKIDGESLYSPFLFSLIGFDFGKFYGDEFSNMIEVHHIKPLSSIRKEYQLNPVEDLIPLCPNCHYVVHAKFDGDVESLREILAKKAKGK